jgi:hypothetical protein
MLHEMTWCYMEWHNATWDDMTQHEMSCNDMMLQEKTCCYMKRHDAKWNDMMLHEMTWCYMKWHDATWNDMILHEMIWCYMRWHDEHEMTWCNMKCSDFAITDLHCTMIPKKAVQRSGYCFLNFAMPTSGLDPAKSRWCQEEKLCPSQGHPTPLSATLLLDYPNRKSKLLLQQSPAGAWARGP